MRLTDIPLATHPPADAAPSDVVRAITRTTARRRGVLRLLVASAGATVLASFDWILAKAAWATPGVTHSEPCSRWDNGPNNWGKRDWGRSICSGGWRRGSFPCEYLKDGDPPGQYHFEGTRVAAGELYESTRLNDICMGEGYNAWLWLMRDENRYYRCSDAMTTVTFLDAEHNAEDDYTDLTIASCPVSRFEVHRERS